jgi:hypothetical protein
MQWVQSWWWAGFSKQDALVAIGTTEPTMLSGDLHVFSGKKNKPQRMKAFVRGIEAWWRMKECEWQCKLIGGEIRRMRGKAQVLSRLPWMAWTMNMSCEDCMVDYCRSHKHGHGWHELWRWLCEGEEITIHCQHASVFAPNKLLYKLKNFSQFEFWNLFCINFMFILFFFMTRTV